jgi:hypothetical protein
MVCGPTVLSRRSCELPCLFGLSQQTTLKCTCSDIYEMPDRATADPEMDGFVGYHHQKTFIARVEAGYYRPRQGGNQTIRGHPALPWVATGNTRQTRGSDTSERLRCRACVNVCHGAIYACRVWQPRLGDRRSEIELGRAAFRRCRAFRRRPRRTASSSHADSWRRGRCTPRGSRFSRRRRRRPRRRCPRR